jgi:hypothetical protein
MNLRSSEVDFSEVWNWEEKDGDDETDESETCGEFLVLLLLLLFSLPLQFI